MNESTHTLRPTVFHEIAALRCENEKIHRTVAELQMANAVFSDQLRAMREESLRRSESESRLQAQLSQAQTEVARLAADLAVAEERQNNLTSLYVAAHQLNGTTDREAVLAAIQEIVINFIGSEEFGVYLRSDDDGLRPIAHVGPSQAIENLPSVTAAVEKGEAYIAEEANAETAPSRVAACIPLKLDDAVMGCIAIFRLLPHKSRFETLDLELFDLLTTHAATALHSASVDGIHREPVQS